MKYMIPKYGNESIMYIISNCKGHPFSGDIMMGYDDGI